MFAINEKIKLIGFNNLTKSLNLNVYKFYYVKNERGSHNFFNFIDKKFGSKRLTEILNEAAEMIGALVLSVSEYDYEPQGASAALLISDGTYETGGAVFAHLDKSHFTAHTYPDYNPVNSTAVFRVDFDLSTCGEISPLKIIEFILGRLEPDVAELDFKIRGFTRADNGKKVFNDGGLNPIFEYIKEISSQYIIDEKSLPEANIFHAVMLRREFDCGARLFDETLVGISSEKFPLINKILQREMAEVFERAETCLK